MKIGRRNNQDKADSYGKEIVWTGESKCEGYYDTQILNYLPFNVLSLTVVFFKS